MLMILSHRQKNASFFVAELRLIDGSFKYQTAGRRSVEAARSEAVEWASKNGHTVL